MSGLLRYVKDNFHTSPEGKFFIKELDSNIHPYNSVLIKLPYGSLWVS